MLHFPLLFMLSEIWGCSLGRVGSKVSPIWILNCLSLSNQEFCNLSMFHLKKRRTDIESSLDNPKSSLTSWIFCCYLFWIISTVHTIKGSYYHSIINLLWILFCRRNQWASHSSTLDPLNHLRHLQSSTLPDYSFWHHTSRTFLLPF